MDATAALSIEDDNGNRPSVAEIRKKFDRNSRLNGAATDNAELQLDMTGVKISENRFIKQDSLEGGSNVSKGVLGGKAVKDTVSVAKANGQAHLGKEEQQRPAKHFKLEVN